MAWVKCKYCNKRISDKVDVCPNCNKKVGKQDKRKVINLVVQILSIIFLLLLSFFLIGISKQLLYSEVLGDLFIVLGICFVLFLSCFIFCKVFINKKKSLINLFFLLVVLGGLFLSFIYCIRSINAFRYDNSLETLKLSEKLNIKDAKKIKQEIDEIFEFDYDGVSSRNVIIGSFYEDDDVYVLYLDDSYNNYRLKFYVVMDKKNIIDVYWNYDDKLLYFVKDGKKTENFEYFYSMYIFSCVCGEDIKGLATVEEDIEKEVNMKLNGFANTMFSYDQLTYNQDSNIFNLECSVDAMDYYGDMESDAFLVSFMRSDQKRSKKVWYYGDSSFDYVSWKIKQ